MAKSERSTDGIIRRLPRKNLDDFSRRPSLGSFGYGYSAQSAPQSPKSHKLDTAKETTAKAALIIENKEAPIGVRYRFTPEIMTKETLPKEKQPSRRQRRRQKRQSKLPKSKLRRVVKWSFATIGIIIGVFTVFVVLKSWTTLSSIIDRAGAGSLLLHGTVKPSQLNGEGDGRVNIMILGVRGGDSRDSPWLADTIMIASLDPFSNELGLLSIPRDMYVSIPGYGMNKINAAGTFGEQASPGGGITLVKQTLEEVLDINIHYYVRVDFNGFVQAVDAIGGVDLTLDKRIYDPTYINDREYGNKALDIGPGIVHLDGIHALMLARARGGAGGSIGLPKSDYSRTENQRALVLALKNKILTLGTYKDPRVIISLLDAIGGHANTDLQVSDMLRLRELTDKITSDKIVSFGLDDYLHGGTNTRGSVQLPNGGDYSQIQVFVRQLFIDGFIKQEAAVVDVLNGTTQEGLANDKAAELKTYGYVVGTVGNAPTRDYTMTTLYDLTGQNPYTKRYLETRFGVIAQSADKLPAGITSTADLVLIIGAGNAATQP